MRGTVLSISICSHVILLHLNITFDDEMSNLYPVVEIHLPPRARDINYLRSKFLKHDFVLPFTFVRPGISSQQSFPIEFSSPKPMLLFEMGQTIGLENLSPTNLWKLRRREASLSRKLPGRLRGRTNASINLATFQGVHSVRPTHAAATNACIRTWMCATRTCPDSITFLVGA